MIPLQIASSKVNLKIGWVCPEISPFVEEINHLDFAHLYDDEIDYHKSRIASYFGLSNHTHEYLFCYHKLLKIENSLFESVQIKRYS